MDAHHITYLTKELIRLKRAKELFNALTLEARGYPLWIIRQQEEFLNTKPAEIESELKKAGITDIEYNLPEKSSQKSPRNRKRPYRSKKPRNQ